VFPLNTDTENKMALFKNIKKGIGSMPRDRRPGRRPATPRISIEQIREMNPDYGMDNRPTPMPIGPGHPLYDPPKDRTPVKPMPRTPVRPPRDIPPPRQPMMPPPWFQQGQNNMGLVQGAPAGNRVAEIYNRAPSVNSLVNPTRTDPGGQEDRQKMMDMQRQMYRRFLAPPPGEDPPVTPPLTPPVTPPITPGEPPITLPPGYPPIDIDFDELEEKYGFTPEDYMPNIDPNFSSVDFRDLPVGLPSITPDIDIDPVDYNIPEIDLSGIDLSNFDPNIMVPRGQDREMPVGLPEPVGIAGLPSFEEMTGGGGFPTEMPPEMIQSIEQTPPTAMPMAPEEVEQAKQVIPQLPTEQIQQVIPQLPPEVIEQVLPSLPPEVIEQVLPMLPPEIIQPPVAPMPAISSYVPPMPVAPVSPKVSPVRRPVRRGGRGARTSKNLGGIVNSVGSMPLKYTYK